MNKNTNISRRQFLKTATLAGLATAGISACTTKETDNTGTTQSGEMTYRTSTSSGDRVSLLGYGMMRLPLRQKADGNGEEIDQEMVNELVDRAIAGGVNYFDTAPVYVRGTSEAATGIALSRYPRDSYYVATKLSTQRDDASIRSLEKGKEMYYKSMADLQVDYIDYYLIHCVGLGSPTKVSDIDEEPSIRTLGERLFDNGMLDFLLAERAAGRIRNLGWSFHGNIKAFDYMLSLHDQGTVHWDFVQIQLNYVDWEHASDPTNNANYLYNELFKRNIPVVIMEPLLGGRLASLPNFLSARLREQRPTESIASWAFRYAGSYEGVLTVLSGMTCMEHLNDNLKTYSPLVPCSAEEIALLADTANKREGLQSIPCTACQYCMPCPYGVDIPGVFSHYNKCINEGHIINSTNDDAYTTARRAYLIGYDRSVPRLRQANHCIGCNQCTPHCPQSIDIPAQMQRIDAYTEELRRNNT